MAFGIIPWSFSSQNAYKTCPRQFYELRVAKNYKQEESEALIWGNDVHKSIEEYGKFGKPMPARMANMQPQVDRFLNAPGETIFEAELACTTELNPTGFWDENAWARAKVDLLKIGNGKAINLDWKTGKRKPDSLQLRMSTALVFIQYPEVDTITTIFYWFQEPSKPTIAKFSRHEDTPEHLLDPFVDTIADMAWSEKNQTWPAKPSGLCKRHCPVRTCPHYGIGKRWG